MTRELARLKSEFGWDPEMALEWDEAASLWCSRETSQSDSVFAPHNSQELSDFMNSSWWAAVRNQVICKAIRSCDTTPTLWDVGGGSGYVAEYLIGHGLDTLCVEPSAEAAATASQRGIFTFRAELRHLNLPNSSLESVGMFDVLEHIESRGQILREIRRVLKPGGQLVLTVPAFEALRSHIDASHFIRYNKRNIREELTKNGFEVVKIGYFFCLTLIPIFLLRAIPYRLRLRFSVSNSASPRATGGPVTRFLGWIENCLALQTPVGSSLLVIARRPQPRRD